MNTITKTTSRGYIRILKEEYLRLKDLQKRFGDFLNYIEHVQEIKKARENIKNKKFVSQEKLFKELGM